MDNYLTEPSQSPPNATGRIVGKKRVNPEIREKSQTPKISLGVYNQTADESHKKELYIDVNESNSLGKAKQKKGFLE
jgi:hypothetical protein